jgi:hypothetical protein
VPHRPGTAPALGLRAGWGWFVDSTPWDDFEFTTSGDRGGPQRRDLLTALDHAIGHLPG